jgi:hypothetical protein
MPDWTTVAGVIGAVGAVLAILWPIRAAWLDRPRLRFVLQPGMKAYPPTSAYGTMTILSIRVTNVGRRPTSVTCVSLLMPKGTQNTYLLCVDPLTATYPVELKENQGHTFVMNEDKIGTQFHLTPDRYVIRVDTAARRAYWSHGLWARCRKSRRLPWQLESTV